MPISVLDEGEQISGAGDRAVEERVAEVLGQDSDGWDRDWEEEHYDKTLEQAGGLAKGTQGSGLGPLTDDIDQWSPNAEHAALVHKELGETQIFMKAQ